MVKQVLEPVLHEADSQNLLISASFSSLMTISRRFAVHREVLIPAWFNILIISIIVIAV